MQPNFPDHPVIRNMEATGYPDGKEPEIYHCPVCGEVCEYLYENSENRKIVGCDLCVITIDPWDI